MGGGTRREQFPGMERYEGIELGKNLDPFCCHNPINSEAAADAQKTVGISLRIVYVEV